MLAIGGIFQNAGRFYKTKDSAWIKDKRCVGELAEELEMSQSAVSHQLNILKANGIVKSQRQGKYIYYIVQDEYVQNAIERCKMLFDKEYCL